MKRTHAGSGPAWSEEMQAWLLVTDQGTRLRLADDRFGQNRWLTEAEARTREVEIKTREVVEAREREAAEKQAREAAEAVLEEQVQARETMAAEVRELRRRLAEMEALRKPRDEE
jgi:hypothetical protein